MKRVDLNVDIGEGFPWDAALMELATSANVCCGEHAGSWELTTETVARCREKGLRVGAHPGFPDRESMGRVVPEDAEALRRWVQNATEQIQRFADAFQPDYVKPHGAFYAVLCGSEATARPAAETLEQGTRLPTMLLAGCELARTWASLGRPVLQEGFADRRYTPEGQLVSRSGLNALLTDLDEVEAQVLRLADHVDSICVHGDRAECVETLARARRALELAGYEVAA